MTEDEAKNRNKRSNRKKIPTTSVRMRVDTKAKIYKIMYEQRVKGNCITFIEVVERLLDFRRMKNIIPGGDYGK